MKICFFGSEEFSLPALKALIDSGHTVTAVVTQPDKKKDRGMAVKATPVALLAESHNIPVFKPEKLKAPAFLDALQALAVDIAVVSAYGKILNSCVLSCPPRGCINIHPSLLPHYRGAMPIEGAIMAGENETGISIFYMDCGCDTGDIIIQKKYAIDPDDTGGSLSERLSLFSSDLLIEALTLIDEGKAPRIMQPEGDTCSTHCIQKADTQISWKSSALEIKNFTRAFWPVPSARATFRGKMIKIAPVKVTTQESLSQALPGTIVEIRKREGPVVATGDGFILLTQVKPEGRKLMTSWEFALGYGPKPGERFGSSSTGPENK
jgi:methionyl-tRNA formyltransferase